MHRETNGIVLSLEMNQETSLISLVYVCVYEGFRFRLGKHFSDERALPFYCLKIGFLEYFRISGEIRYPN